MVKEIETATQYGVENQKGLKMVERNDNIKIVKITQDRVIYKCGREIINAPLTEQAKQVLKWYSKNIPAND